MARLEAHRGTGRDGLRDDWLQSAGSGEDRLLLAKLWDLAVRSERENWPVTGFFLDERQQTLLSRLMRKWGGQMHIVCHFWGAYREAVRKIPVFIPDSRREEAEGAEAFTWPQLWGDDPLAYYRLRFAGEADPGHRDLLGALMGLGIERDRTGDILMHEEGADLIVMREIGDLVKQELRQVGRDEVEPVALAKATELNLGTVNIKERKVSLASLRLDNVLAAVWHLGREEAKRMIEEGLVSLDGLIVERASALVTEGQMVRCRGLGKFRIVSVGGLSRKGRIWLTCGVYR